MTLTKEQILSMPAGREMNGLVAERVFGLELSANRQFTTHRWKSNDGASSGAVSQRLLAYSTDITDAMQVVERLNKTHYLDVAQYWIEGGSNGGVLGFRVLFSRFQTYEDSAANADILATAICRAALLTTL